MTFKAALLLLAAALLQVTLVGRLDPAVPAPNLVLALCAGRALTGGARSGMVWALVGGALLDLAGAVGPLGVHALAMLGATYAVGVVAAAFESTRPGVAALAGALAGAVYGGTILLGADTLGLARVSPAAALPLLAGGAVMAGALAALATALMRGRTPLEVAPTWR